MPQIFFRKNILARFMSEEELDKLEKEYEIHLIKSHTLKLKNDKINYEFFKKDFNDIQ